MFPQETFPIQDLEKNKVEIELIAQADKKLKIFRAQEICMQSNLKVAQPCTYNEDTENLVQFCRAVPYDSTCQNTLKFRTLCTHQRAS